VVKSMIVLPNYDDQTFTDIMEMAKRRIPVIYPEWTDMNEHDPGITLLELFAWLKEMQQYQLNRITEEGYESMLKLLGVNLFVPSPAETIVVFHSTSEPCVLPAQMRFTAAGGTEFEAQGNIRLNDYEIQSVCLLAGEEFLAVKEMLAENDVHFHIFGENPSEGKASFYIGVDKKTTVDNPVLNLYFLLYDNYPVKRNPFGKSLYTPRRVAWEYAISQDDQIVFRPLEVLEDNTHALAQSGNIALKLDQDAARVKIDRKLPECIWLRVRLLDQGCEEAPRLSGIFANAVKLTQRRTLCQTIGYILDGLGSTEIIADTWLAMTGKMMVMIRDAYGWKTHDNFQARTEQRNGGAVTVVTLTDLPEEMLFDGQENLRLLCYEAEFERSMLLPGSSGLPNQQFPLECRGQILTENLKVMVKEETEDGQARWTDWDYIEDFCKTGPYDRKFSFDRKKKQIVFGDNEHGLVPNAGKENILIVSCAATLGSTGNIPRDSFETLNFQGTELLPYNILPAAGGYDGETVKMAVKRFQASMQMCVKAVTTSDYEELVYRTPGLRIWGAKAIPYYDPDNRATGGGEAPATVTVVVIPYSDERFPRPDSRFLNEVRKHLDQYRLITTQVKVIGPAYIKISVYAEVVLKNEYSIYTIGEIQNIIEGMFDLQDKTARTRKPDFGKTVRESDLVSLISSVPGVNQVKRVVLGVRGNDSFKDRFGNIIIPAYGIPYLGDLEIQPVEYV